MQISQDFDVFYVSLYVNAMRGQYGKGKVAAKRKEARAAIAVYGAALALGLGGCGGFYREKSTPLSGSTVSGSQEAVTYAMVRDGVLNPSCSECHSSRSNISLSTYEQVRAALPKIEQRVILQKSMPPATRPALTQIQLQLLASWIAKGAPERINEEINPVPSPIPSTSPSPSPNPEPVDTFGTLKRDIFSEYKCTMCHRGPHPPAGVSFDTKDALLSPTVGAVVPGEPDKSKVVLAIESTDPSRWMPPREENQDGVTPKLRQRLREWIKLGAKE